MWTAGSSSPATSSTAITTPTSLPGESSGGSLVDTVVFTDIKSIFNQASVLYMYRKGYVEPEAPDTFGGKATARLGEFIDVLYRIAGRPETDNTALPADYENEEFNAAHPYYNAVCWAYQTRLLRQMIPIPNTMTRWTIRRRAY